MIATLNGTRAETDLVEPPIQPMAGTPELRALKQNLHRESPSLPDPAAVAPHHHDGSSLPHETPRKAITRENHEFFGLGPLEPLLGDPSVSDILVNGASVIYIERGGKLQLTPLAFENDAHLLAVIKKIVGQVGRHIDETSPFVDARLPDGSRVNATMPPLTIDGPMLSFRRFGAGSLSP